jgi:hypothetical protein
VAVLYCERLKFHEFGERISMRHLTLALLVLAVSSHSASAQSDDDEFDAAADQAALLNGISEIEFPGVPGEVVVFGPRAFALAIARAGERPAAVIAAARYRRGRIVLVGHAGFLTTSETGQTRQFLGNAILWASDKPMNKPGSCESECMVSMDS